LARKVATHGPGLVAITRGAAGALALEHGQSRAQPVIPTRVADRLGAGDGFIAGLLTARLAGVALADQFAAGAPNAADICRHRGAFGHETPIRPGQPGLIRPAASLGFATSALSEVTLTRSIARGSLVAVASR
jgi:fructoselysine 6-kinase